MFKSRLLGFIRGNSAKGDSSNLVRITYVRLNVYDRLIKPILDITLKISKFLLLGSVSIKEIEAK